ncbi:glucose-6-phosphate isomerase [Parabacteroides sp. PF5-5]|uniref:glucose-6-phosphate isomerase family protein n=1 Tax=unclassified Parabacteroides TaxID=2649774 RepID=UPI002476F2A0|nr:MULTISPECIES: glucose-6-phosphate isomerase family protein [unclassified Parabacteroides]MDH6306530.1 glucose-6-phosphate isomerase [Parabacteroides sp. PH5-39]MDH6317497.1 glucose-6-phosphate isomerase [Parabacteroides sp. PF5-13]MDH6321200.1 glucose-6-phosphate isomerase [Parabacteroides sp. PH5-13]MDH6324932.1 glucose-6-phosphate isomerase [Parabacteroides sp. PH5-8]MDH6328641.1 glucose-6-phosphate isomerase [Parabacteroides sp. PH5-41]
MKPEKIFDNGIDIRPHSSGIGFIYGEDVFGPEPENRRLDDIRKSLMNPSCTGPEVVYSIAMDVGKKKDKELLESLHLLFGVVTYAAGTLGQEPVRSQGHIHKISAYSGWSTPEIYEIWTGKAIIYMQETAEDYPGKCYAVLAKPGDIVIVPPYWVHATISADLENPLTFGAWCDRDYGFIYDGVRQHNGIAWFPIYDETKELIWKANPAYKPSTLIRKRPGDYSALGITKGQPIYKAFEENPERFLYVARPQLKENVWKHFEP